MLYLQISVVESEINKLREELALTKSLLTAKETIANSDMVEKPPPVPAVPSRIKKREPSPVPDISDTPLSEEDIPVQNGEAQSEDSDKEDAFDKSSPSPQVPYPYVDFVPLQPETKVESPKKSNKEKQRDEKPEKVSAESNVEKNLEQSGQINEKDEDKKDVKEQEIVPDGEETSTNETSTVDNGGHISEEETTITKEEGMY